ncbi:CPBP family intramembrane glutamic endopeptidase [Salinispora tropica]|uniref:Abortive infection protein n=1 Tax=Salinispora tropica (strain ATCC BAA-916 / DSM 44818 / JCM 13857 / NBRC 105044 / CNB-440) TaxID=369723 RepID=A4X1A5_SALTO|nr:CPBP family intramembrane glutamic endopeptidase [Salinispora tropica]ABP52655.1 Abortive infection protein [Salinispora tropica CNB-440]
MGGGTTQNRLGPSGQRPSTRASTSTDPPAQYSLKKILGIWAAVTLPMGLGYWVITPAVADGPYDTVVLATVTLAAGLVWQFVLAMLILRREEGSVGLSAMARRLWLQVPRDPVSGRPRKRLLWLLAPLGIAFVLNMLYVAPVIQNLQQHLLPGPAPLPFQKAETLFSAEVASQMEGAWWFFALFLTLSVFNVFLGEEFIFRGILLPRMQGVFGSADWLANGVLFGLYHVHQPWTAGGIMLTSGLIMSLPVRRYRSMWLSVIPHSIQTVIVFGMLLGLMRGTA